MTLSGTTQWPLTLAALRLRLVGPVRLQLRWSTARSLVVPSSRTPCSTANLQKREQSRREEWETSDRPRVQSYASEVDFINRARRRHPPLVCVLSGHAEELLRMRFLRKARQKLAIAICTSPPENEEVSEHMEGARLT